MNLQIQIVTLLINGIQVDIQAVIIIDKSSGQQLSGSNYMYFARATPGGDEAANNKTTPCSNNPCQNGALCVIVTNKNYNCLCTAGWAGKNYFLWDK